MISKGNCPAIDIFARIRIHRESMIASFWLSRERVVKGLPRVLMVDVVSVIKNQSTTTIFIAAVMIRLAEYV